MAALQSIRGKAGLLVTVLGVALLAFILSDFFTSGNAIFSKVKDNAFSVDGDVVNTKAYADRIEEWETLQKIMSNNSSLDEMTRANLRENVYQQMVKEMMLDEQAQALGLAVTAEELNMMVHGANVSPILQRLGLFNDPQTGQFDRSALNFFLESINKDVSSLPAEQVADMMSAKTLWLTIERLLKYQKLEEKYASLVAGTVLVNDVEKAAFVADENKEASINYVMQPYSSISDSAVQVTDADMKALYEKRKNNFKIDAELRKVSYFIKDVIPSEEDYAAVEKEMAAGAERLRTAENPAVVVNNYPGNQYINAYTAIAGLPNNMKEFIVSSSAGAVFGPIREGQDYMMYKVVDKATAPDSIQLKMIMFPTEIDYATVATISDSLLIAINKGRKFEDVADEFMPGSNGGNIGMLDEISLVAGGIPQECITGAVGSVMKISLNGQPRLVKIAGKSKPVAKAKIALVKMPVLISDKTQNAADNELSQFINQYGNIKDFSKAAEGQGYSIVDNALLHPATIALDETPNTRSVIQWAFAQDVGTVKKFDFTDKRIVAIVNEKIVSEYLPLAEVKDGLKMELLRDKKAEKMITDLKAKQLTTLEAYATAVDSKVEEAKFVSFLTNQISPVGYEPIFNVYAKSAELNKVSEPLKGNFGVYVLDVVNSELERSTSSAEQVAQRLQQQHFYGLASTATAVLHDKMNVKDNRVNFW